MQSWWASMQLQMGCLSVEGERRSGSEVELFIMQIILQLSNLQQMPQCSRRQRQLGQQRAQTEQDAQLISQLFHPYSTYIIMSDNIHNCSQPSTATETSMIAAHKCSHIHLDTTTCSPNTSHKYEPVCAQQQPKQPASSWCDWQLLYLIDLIIQQVDHNEVFDCDYAHLFVGLAYLQAHKFSVQGKAKKLETYGFDLFMATLQKVNSIKRMQPAQLQQAVFQKVATECLNFYRHNQDQQYFMGELRRFLLQHGATMNSFMPVYYRYFSCAANYPAIFNQPPELEDMRSWLQAQRSEALKKYNKAELL